jgi:chromosomal replication initiator protein
MASDTSAQPAPYALGDDALDARDVWDSVLTDLQTQMSRVSFDTWLAGTQVLGVDAGTLIVSVQDEYSADWLRTRWLTPIQRAVADVVGTPVPVVFQVRV